MFVTSSFRYKKHKPKPKHKKKPKHSMLIFTFLLFFFCMKNVCIVALNSVFTLLVMDMKHAWNRNIKHVISVASAK